MVIVMKAREGKAKVRKVGLGEEDKAGEGEGEAVLDEAGVEQVAVLAPPLGEALLAISRTNLLVDKRSKGKRLPRKPARIKVAIIAPFFRNTVAPRAVFIVHS